MKYRTGSVDVAAIGTPLFHVAVTKELEETVTVSAGTPVKLADATNPDKRRLDPVNVRVFLSEDNEIVETEGIEVEV